MARPQSLKAHDALAAAIDTELYEHGLHEATIDRICERAGVSKPALYRHFGSRGEILVDYLARRRVRRMAAITAAMNRAGQKPIVRITALID